MPLISNGIGFFFGVAYLEADDSLPPPADGGLLAAAAAAAAALGDFPAPPTPLPEKVVLLRTLDVVFFAGFLLTLPDSAEDDGTLSVSSVEKK